MALTDRDAAFFRVLVHFNQSRTIDEQAIYLSERFVAVRSGRESTARVSGRATGSMAHQATVGMPLLEGDGAKAPPPFCFHQQYNDVNRKRAEKAIRTQSRFHPLSNSIRSSIFNLNTRMMTPTPMLMSIVERGSVVPSFVQV